MGAVIRPVGTFLFTDARHLQIATLSSLLLFLLFFHDFAPDIKVVFMTVLSALIAQIFFCWVFIFNHRDAEAQSFYLKKLRVSVPLWLIKTDFRSPFITSLSLCLLLKANALWVFPLAALAAIGSKFLIRHKDKHIFNPANFAIVAGLIVFPDLVWVSPGQWGADIWLGFALAAAAVLVLSTARRGDMALLFLGFWGALLLGRALWLGDPLEIPLHQFQSGALLIFAFFMISDPKTTPDHLLGRVMFAAATALLAFTLQFEFQVREALFYALFATCVSVPFIDSVLKAKTYQWGNA